MSRNPETNFINSVHRLLPPIEEFYRMKNHNMYNGGIADSWYDGYNGKLDLWIEWKFIEVPKRATTVIDLTGGKKPIVSRLQEDWICDRLMNGRRVWLVVGCKAGGVIYMGNEWLLPTTTDNFVSRIATRPQIAHKILTSCQ